MISIYISIIYATMVNGEAVKDIIKAYVLFIDLTECTVI